MGAASTGEYRSGIAVIGYYDVSLFQKIGQDAGFGLGEGVVPTRPAMFALGGEGIWLPVVARAAIQVGVGVAIQVYAPGVEATVQGQAVGVSDGDEPQRHSGRHVLRVSLEVGMEFQQQIVGIGLVAAVDVTDQRHLVAA